MNIVHIPRRFVSQPQYSPRLSLEYQDAELLSLFNARDGRDIAKGNNLSSANPATQVVRQHGKALTFSGAFMDSLRAVKQSPLLTVFAWVRPIALNSGYSRILETQYSSGFYLGSNSGTQYAFIVAGSALEGCIGGQQVAGKRDFLCGVFDGTNITLYVNGEAVGTTTASSPVASDLLRVGESNAGGSFPWNGDIDTVGIFTRAFTATQVKTLYLDPWRLLKAPDAILAFTPSAVVAATIPVFANHYRNQGIM